MTFDALHGNLGELRRLKEFVLEERTIGTSSVANSTRSANVTLSSTMESSLKTSKAPSSKINLSARGSIDSPGMLGSQKEKLESKKKKLNAHLDPSKLIDEVQNVTPARDYCEVIIEMYDHEKKLIGAPKIICHASHFVRTTHCVF